MASLYTISGAWDPWKIATVVLGSVTAVFIIMVLAVILMKRCNKSARQTDGDMSRASVGGMADVDIHDVSFKIPRPKLHHWKTGVGLFDTMSSASGRSLADSYADDNGEPRQLGVRELSDKRGQHDTNRYLVRRCNIIISM